MHQNLPILFFFLSLILNSHVAIAAKADFSPKAWKLLNSEDGSEVVVAVEKTTLYADADVKSTALGVGDWADELSVDQERLQVAPKGWVPIKPLQKISASWIRQKDIVIGDQMRKVTSCWPIKRAFASLGDYEVDIRFNQNGTGYAQEFSDTPLPSNIPKFEKVQVYIERNIVKIIRVRTGRADFFGLAAYRPDTRSLYIRGYPAAKQENFPLANLKGCGPSPWLKKKD